MFEVKDKNLDKLRAFFSDIRFYMGRSVLDGKMGKAFIDNTKSPTFAMLLVRKYCFISGSTDINTLSNVIDNYNLKNCIIIPNDEIKVLLEKNYNDIYKFQRYSLKKNINFDVKKLIEFTKNSDEKFVFTKINSDLAKRIKLESFITITDNYEDNGIGYCCLYNNNIIGVATSNIIYSDGIEINIKVNELYRRKGIATTLASLLILDCLEKNIKVSWDAANVNSLALAEKLGFEYDSKYDCYKFIGGKNG